MALEYSLEEEVATVRLDRPDYMNALTTDLGNSLREALERSEREARVVVLTGNGDAFCAGADLQDSPISPEQSFEELKRSLTVFQSVTGTIRELSVPVVTKVNGPAMGAGCDIALAGDFRVAAESARFCESFVNVGLVSGDGGAFQLPRLVGEPTAKEMLMLGHEVVGQEAAEKGLVNEVVPDDELDDAVDRYVDEILSLPPTALSRTKQLVNDSFNQTMNESFSNALYAMWVSLQSEDFEEARRAFQEGREPEFSG